MPRLLLTDELWSKLRKILLQESIYDKRDLRMTVEGMLYRMRGLPLAGSTQSQLLKPGYRLYIEGLGIGVEVLFRDTPAT
jgi:hypothetical protein